ncbi:hypothetical protein ACFE04_026308 [Oxalis oulophora]
MAAQNRPWFRLAAISRPALATEPTPAPVQSQGPSLPQPRPPVVRPTTFRPVAQPPQILPPAVNAPPPPRPTTSPPAPTSVTNGASSYVPTSPILKAAASPPPSVPNSPAKTVTTNSPTKVIPNSTSLTTSPARGMPVSPTTTNNVPNTFSPKQSPKTIKHVDKTPPPTPYRSQHMATPPSQINQPKFPTQPDNMKKETDINHKPGNDKPSDPEQGNMKVITMAGENRGAFMEVIHSPKKKHNGYTTYSSSSDQERSPRNNNNNKHKGKSMNNTLPMRAFMNSNVQGVNNSIVYNSSCTHHDPGVHLALTPGDGFHVKDSVCAHH